MRNAEFHCQLVRVRFPPVHLYVHVPFCQRRCSYCDFSIAVRKRIPTGEYVETILTEAARIPTSHLETIYLGGGTPSLLPSDAIRTLLHELTQRFRMPHSAFRITVTLRSEY